MACVICMGDIKQDECANLKCGHSFHTKCLMENLANGVNGHTCPLCRDEICKEPENSKINAILNDQLHDLEYGMECHRDYVMYFYDNADKHYSQYLEVVEENKYLKKKNLSLKRNLKRAQYFHVGNSNIKKSYIKCSRCNHFGHNSKSCQINPIAEVFVNPIEVAEELRDKDELFEDLYDGELGKLIEDHFIE